MKYFAIRPINNISDVYREGIEAQLRLIRSEGHEVYDPLVDTNQNDRTGYRCCRDNLAAMKECDAVLFIWDGESMGCIFDLGMAFALGKPVRTVVGYVPPVRGGTKSFQNVAFYLEENGYG